MAALGKRILNDINLKKTVFFLCDMQEKFRPSIKYFPDIVEVAKRMVLASKILNIPLVITEQYPKGLGNTVSELDVSHGKVFPKTKFSMVMPEVEQHISSVCSEKPEHIVLFGIESHVCIQQTVIDLLQKNYQVHVVADACSSRSLMDRMFAYERFKSYDGVALTTSEAILLQLVGDKDHPNFKEIQGVIRNSAPTSGLLPPFEAQL